MTKNYVYSLTHKPYKTGIKYKARISRIVKNAPVFVDEIEFDSASTKGDLSEVFKALYYAGEVSKEDYEKHDGYYFTNLFPNIKIHHV